jgi:hypothetical protein
MKMGGFDFYVIRVHNSIIPYKKLHYQTKLRTSYMIGTIHRALNHDDTTIYNNTLTADL